MRRDPTVRKCLDAAFPRRRRVRWTMTSQQILSGVRAGTLFGMIKCDICVPEELREHFAEMQPVFKNIRLIREDLGPFMRRYAEEHNIMTTPRRMLVAVIVAIRYCSQRPCCDGIWTTVSRCCTFTRSSSTILFRVSGGSAMQCRWPDARETSTQTRPSSRIP